MDKYMEQAIREILGLKYGIDPASLSLGELESFQKHMGDRINDLVRFGVCSRASELRLLDMLRRMHDPEFCPYKECDACALLAQYKDVKTH